jgi:hypothetical protein
MTKKVIALASLIAAAAAPTIARADVDVDLRRDVRSEVRTGRVDRLARIEAMGEAPAPFTLSLDLSGALSSNAGATADDEIAAAYAGPLATVRYAAPDAVGGWSFSAALQGGGSYYSRAGGALDEGDALANASLSRPFADGEFSLIYSALGSYDGGFDQRLQTTLDYGARYVRKFGEGGRDRFDLRAFYRASDRESARRSVLRLDLAHAFASGPLGATWELGERLQYADYRLVGRGSDLLTSTSIGPSWVVGKATVSLAASYAHNFSDAAAARADIFEFGPTVSFSTAP